MKQDTAHRITPRTALHAASLVLALILMNLMPGPASLAVLAVAVGGALAGLRERGGTDPRGRREPRLWRS